MNTFKERMKNKEVLMGSWITLGHPSIAEIMVQSGFDWLTIDMEHSAITLAEAQHLIQVIGLAGKIPLVRVGENNPLLIKRVMDSGAVGVVVPRVNSKQDAICAVEAVRYPPLGKRGVGLGRAQGYGTRFEDYKKWLTKESVVIVQIEHVRAVENVEDIVKVEGVDGFIVGLYDLSASLGVAGQLDHPRVVQSVSRILDVTANYPVSAGIHVVPPEIKLVKNKIGEGFNLIAFCLDSLFLKQVCSEQLTALRLLVAESLQRS